MVSARDRGRSRYVDSNIIISLALHDDDYDAAKSLVESSPGILTSTWGSWRWRQCCTEGFPENGEWP
ncbi:MAG: hypothetical protein ACP5QI_05545 [Candidatus Bathyarchaeia archaeon]|jgi:hypothetical protein